MLREHIVLKFIHTFEEKRYCTFFDNFWQKYLQLSDSTPIKTVGVVSDMAIPKCFIIQQNKKTFIMFKNNLDFLYQWQLDSYISLTIYEFLKAISSLIGKCI